MNGRYIVVMGWMMSTLGLSGNDLLCYALIYGYSQDSQGAYFGSIAHTAEALNIGKRTAVDVLNRLVERGCVSKQNVKINGVDRCIYKAIVPECMNTTPIPDNGSRPAQRRSSSNPKVMPPSLEEVKEYCRQRGNNVDAERFLDYYTANGWVQGRGKPIKDWRAAVRTWEKMNIVHYRNGNRNDKECIIAQRRGELQREIDTIDAAYRKNTLGQYDARAVPDAT